MSKQNHLTYKASHHISPFHQRTNPPKPQRIGSFLHHFCITMGQTGSAFVQLMKPSVWATEVVLERVESDRSMELHQGHRGISSWRPLWPQGKHVKAMTINILPKSVAFFGEKTSIFPNNKQIEKYQVKVSVDFKYIIIYINWQPPSVLVASCTLNPCIFVLKRGTCSSHCRLRSAKLSEGNHPKDWSLRKVFDKAITRSMPAAKDMVKNGERWGRFSCGEKIRSFTPVVLVSRVTIPIIQDACLSSNAYLIIVVHCTTDISYM